MTKIPTAVKCTQEYLDKVLPYFKRVEMKKDSMIGYPVSTLNGIEVIVDNSLTKDYEFVYKEIPDVEEIIKSIETLKNAGYFKN